MNDYFDEEQFSKLDQADLFADNATFEDCTFDTCLLQNVDFSGCKFINCQFTGCDLSNIKVVGTAFQEIYFSNCKMIGIQFDTINPLLFEVSFTQLHVRSNIFLCRYGQILSLRQKSVPCSMQILTEAKLQDSVWIGSDLLNAAFDQTVLNEADFRHASNLKLNPNQNQIRRAKFSQDALPGLLTDFDIIIE